MEAKSIVLVPNIISPFFMPFPYMSYSIYMQPYLLYSISDCLATVNFLSFYQAKMFWKSLLLLRSTLGFYIGTRYIPYIL